MSEAETVITSNEIGQSSSVGDSVVRSLDRNSSLEKVLGVLDLVGKTAIRLGRLPSVEDVNGMNDVDISYILRHEGAIVEINRLSEVLTGYEIARNIKVGKDGQPAQKVKDFDDPNVMLAVRVAGHDVRNKLAVLSGYYQMLKGNASGVDYNPRLVKNMLKGVPTIRALAASMAFFGTRNHSVLYNVAGSDVGSIVAEREEIMHGVECNIYYDTSKVKSVPVVLCHIISQLVKNSKKNYLTHHSLPTKCTEPYRIWVKIEELDDNYLISVRDNGTGFLDREGNPIPAEELGKVLHPKYTTCGTGLGLGVLPGYLELLGGGIQIVTTNTKEGDSKYYDTLEDDVGRSISRQMSNGQNGTEITFIMDKQKFREWNMIQ